MKGSGRERLLSLYNIKRIQSKHRKRANVSRYALGMADSLRESQSGYVYGSPTQPANANLPVPRLHIFPYADINSFP